MHGTGAVFRWAALASIALAAGCTRAADETRTPGTAAVDSHPTATFVNRVWRVTESSAVEPGTLYVFLSEGTLVITSPHSRPMLGTWRREQGALTMTEEGIAYPVDVLTLTENEFRLRSHNPGEPVEITLVPAG